MALRRVQVLQQRGPRAAPEAVQNPPAGAAKDEQREIAHTDQDRKILQLCGEDSAGARPGGEEGSNLGGSRGLVGAGPCLEWAGPERWRGPEQLGSNWEIYGLGEPVKPEAAQSWGSLWALSLTRAPLLQGNSTTWMPLPCSSKSSNM